MTAYRDAQGRVDALQAELDTARAKLGESDKLIRSLQAKDRSRQPQPAPPQRTGPTLVVGAVVGLIVASAFYALIHSFSASPAGLDKLRCGKEALRAIETARQNAAWVQCYSKCLGGPGVTTSCASELLQCQSACTEAGP